MWGFEYGVNEWGVAIGNEEVFTVDKPADQPPALTGMDLVRLGLERARDADEALDAMTELLITHGQGGIANRADDLAYFSSFLIADARSAWVLETSARTWAARPVEGADSISNWLTIGTDWTRSSADLESGVDFGGWRHPTMWRGHADVRRAATGAAVRRDGPIEAADLVATLRDHGTGPWGRPLPRGDASGAVAALPPTDFDPGTGAGFSVCSHLRGWQATTSSIVADLPADRSAPIRAWVAPASPCASVFVPVFPPDAVPTALTDPSCIARFGAIARSVESEGTARLEAVRSVFGPLERELWEEADALAASGRASDPRAGAAFASSAWHRVEHALDILAPATDSS
jgi:hypothetical protein